MSPPSASLPSAPLTLGGKLALAAADIKLSHSVFALPFALLGAALALPRGADGRFIATVVALVVGCMVCARTWAMLVNRIADAGFDINNPRTARRAVASGKLPRRDAILFALACAVGFIGLTSVFGLLYANWWPLILSVPVLGWLAFYSFAKRFTALCHLLLGTALAISPLCAAVAVRPTSLTDTPCIYALCGMVAMWVAGFDVLYALQDVDFDRSTGLWSLPAMLGPKGAVWLSRGMHVLAAACLVLAITLEPRLRFAFPIAVAVACLCLVAEHIVLVRRGLAGLPLAFFTLNGVISLILGTAGIIDVIRAAA